MAVRKGEASRDGALGKIDYASGGGLTVVAKLLKIWWAGTVRTSGREWFQAIAVFRHLPLPSAASAEILRA